MDRDDFVMMVARNLEAAMARKGTNPSEVARNAGINPTGVYDILSGKSRSPRLDTLQKIASRGLHVSLASLFTNPSDDQVTQELLETIGLMDVEDQKRVLAMVHALLDSSKP